MSTISRCKQSLQQQPQQLCPFFESRLIPLRTGDALAERASVMATLSTLRELYQKSCLLQA